MSSSELAGRGNLLELVLENVPQGIALCSKEGELLYSNMALHALVHSSRENKILPCGLRDLVRETFDRNIEIERDLTLTDENKVHYIEARCALLVTQDAALLTLHDVTRIKHLEQVRQDFVANVSHELRTPVTSIRGAAETLLDSALSSPEDAQRFTGIIARQSERLSRIIEDLLSLSRIEQGSEAEIIEFEEQDLSFIIQAAVRNCEPRASDAGIHLDFTNKLEIVLPVNRTLLEQAIGNLIENAIEHSQRNGKIELSLERKTNTAVINVRDFGCGIEKEHLSRLFERFYRVDKSRNRKFGGTGLGLAIVKHVTLAHRGKISVWSEVGSGSCFSIELPLQ